MSDDTCTAAEAAALLGWSVSTVYRRAYRGEIPAELAHRPVRIEHTYIDAVRRALETTIDVSVAAARLGVGTKAVYNMTYAGVLERHPDLMPQTRITAASLERALALRGAARAA